MLGASSSLDRVVLFRSLHLSFLTLFFLLLSIFDNEVGDREFEVDEGELSAVEVHGINFHELPLLTAIRLTFLFIHFILKLVINQRVIHACQ